MSSVSSQIRREKAEARQSAAIRRIAGLPRTWTRILPKEEGDEKLGLLYRVHTTLYDEYGPEGTYTGCVYVKNMNSTTVSYVVHNGRMVHVAVCHTERQRAEVERVAMEYLYGTRS